MNTSNLRLYFRMLICVIGMLFPLFLSLSGGNDVNSFSQYYYTPAKPVFVYLCAIMALNMLGTNKWEPCAILMLIVAIFPCNEYMTLHNFAAILFFIWSTVIMCQDKRLNRLGYLMILVAPAYLYSLYLGEVLQIFLISLFHFRYLKLIKNTKNRIA